MSSENVIIAVDGQAASGKGTLSRRLCEFYGFAYLDTGALYRGVGWVMLSRNLDPRDEAAAEEVAKGFCVSDIADADIRTPDVGRSASVVAAQGPVRAALLNYQREFAAKPPGGAAGAVLDGRDIGTVVCPDALVKFFVTASLEERARRRWKEHVARDSSVSFDVTLEDLRRRDARDSGREHAPMRPADDAEVVDTTTMPPEAVFARAQRLINRALDSQSSEQGAAASTGQS